VSPYDNAAPRVQATAESRGEHIQIDVVRPLSYGLIASSLFDDVRNRARLREDRVAAHFANCD